MKSSEWLFLQHCYCTLPVSASLPWFSTEIAIYLGNGFIYPVSELASQRALWSAMNNDMVVLRSRLKFGKCAFSIAAPRAWNSIPADLRTTLNTATFKKNLKTFLIRESYLTFWLNSCVTFALLHCPFLFLVYCIFSDRAGRPLLWAPAACHYHYYHYIGSFLLWDVNRKSQAADRSVSVLMIFSDP